MTVMDTRADVVSDPVAELDVTPPRRPTPRWLDVGIGVAVAALGLGVAVLGHHARPPGGDPDLGDRPGCRRGEPRGAARRRRPEQLGLVTKKLLRVGIVLLGFSVSFASIAALGLPLIAVVAGEPRRHARVHDVARAAGWGSARPGPC